MICPKCHKYTYAYMNGDFGSDICAEFCYCGFYEVKPIYKQHSVEIIKNLNLIISLGV